MVGRCSAATLIGYRVKHPRAFPDLLDVPFADQFDEMDIGFVEGKEMIKFRQGLSENALGNLKGRLLVPISPNHRSGPS